MCDTITATGRATESGTALFGKNSDRAHDEAQYLELIPAKRHAVGARVRMTYQEIEQIRETHAVLLSKPHWIWGAEIGANEHGLVVGNEALHSKIAASLAEGVIGMDYLRLALERASSVDEAIDVITSLLREHGQSGNCAWRGELAYHNSFIIADAESAKVLETVDREWVVKEVEDYYAISNTMTIEGQFQSCSDTVERRAVEAGIYRSGAPFEFKSVYEDAAKVASGCWRRARSMQLLAANSGRLQQTDFFRILRDHEEGPLLQGRTSGPRICAHTSENPIGQTTASWVADLTPGKTVHWVTATSAPCTGLFKPVIFECGLPDHGPKPGGQEDAVSLWWRHEQLRRALGSAGPDVRDAYTVERDRLEARFLAEMASCPAVSDDVSRVRARSIVEKCWRDGLAFEARWHEWLCGAASV